MNPTPKGLTSNNIKTSPHIGGISLQSTLDAFSAPRRLGRSSKVQSARTFCRMLKRDIYPNLKFKRRHNTIYDDDVFLDLLTHTAITHNFTESGSETFRLHNSKAPHVNTVLYHVKKFETKEVMEMFERVFDKIYKTAKPFGIFKGSVDVAIDLTDQLYYGDKNDPMVVGTKPQRGTSHAFRYATINIVDKGKRFTLLALPMSALSSKEHVVRKLLEYTMLKVKINNVYLDRGFFSMVIIKLLKEMGLKFLMPAIQNKAIKKLVDEHPSPSVIDYKMGVLKRKRSTKYRPNATNFNLAIVEDETGIKRTFATNLDVKENDALSLFKLYGKRWGIETSYRVKGEFKPKTTSKNYVVRLFYFLFSVCLYNLWILASLFIGAVISKFIFKKPLITAKVFGTLLYTTVYWDDGG